jgi:RNA polymerase sigma factor (sigma-70 family)
LEYEKIFRIAKSILYKRNIYIDDEQSSETLKDAVSEAIVLYYEMHKDIDEQENRERWVCSAAVNKFMHLFKFYEKTKLFSPSRFDEMFEIFSPENDFTHQETDFRDSLAEHCSQDEIELLVNIYVYRYKYKEIACIMNISEDAVKQRKKRLIDKLKKYPIQR